MQSAKRVASWSVVLSVVLALAVGTKGLAAQNVGDTPVPGAPFVDRSWPDVRLNVVVLDKHGVPQRVDERKFQLFEEDVERPVQVQGSMDSPVSLALMIDLSSSIFNRKDAMINAVKALVKKLPDGSEVSVVDFNVASYLDLPFTDVSKADFSFLDKLPSGGQTALYAGVLATADYVVAHAKYPRRALVILSDGEDNASGGSKMQMSESLARSGAPIVYACTSSKANVLKRGSVEGKTNMKYLAREGGGPDFVLGSDPEATGAEIAAAIRSQYVLQFPTADPTRDGEGRKLRVSLPDKGLQVYGMHMYFPPEK